MADHYEMVAWDAHGIADAVNPREIVTIYDPEHVLAVDPRVPKPALGFNMNGCGGGPVLLIRVVNGLLRWFGCAMTGVLRRGTGGAGTGKATAEWAEKSRTNLLMGGYRVVPVPRLSWQSESIE